jgi:hypothetical protein
VISPDVIRSAVIGGTAGEGNPAVRAISVVHDLVRKPALAPDQAGGGPFGTMLEQAQEQVALPQRAMFTFCLSASSPTAPTTTSEPTT